MALLQLKWPSGLISFKRPTALSFKKANWPYVLKAQRGLVFKRPTALSFKAKGRRPYYIYIYIYISSN